jgi:hypothetical protein
MDRAPLDLQPPTLLEDARTHWRSFWPVWAFPFFLLYGSLAADKFGHSLIFRAVCLPLFVWSVARALGPGLRREMGYWHTVLLSGVVPVLFWAIAVFSCPWNS